MLPTEPLQRPLREGPSHSPLSCFNTSDPPTPNTRPARGRPYPNPPAGWCLYLLGQHLPGCCPSSSAYCPLPLLPHQAALQAEISTPGCHFSRVSPLSGSLPPLHTYSQPSVPASQSSSREAATGAVLLPALAAGTAHTPELRPLYGCLIPKPPGPARWEGHTRRRGP